MITVDPIKYQLALETIYDSCLNSEKKADPISLARSIMEKPEINLHGPEHHVLVGAVLLTAAIHSGSALDLAETLDEILERGKALPPAICGLWGCCGAAVSNGVFLSILLKATPYSKDERRSAQTLTAESLMEIAKFGGPRCCKRESFTAILHATEFVRVNHGIQMTVPNHLTCPFSERNKSTCIGIQCPYNKNSQK